MANDSLENADSIFREKLKYYTGKFSFTITQKFTSIAVKKDSLLNDRVKILTSADGLFRIYSWDARSDGTMYGFENVFQYKIGSKTNSILEFDNVYAHVDKYIYYYSALYSLKVNKKSYYLAVYNGGYTRLEAGEGVQVFTIENGKLNDDVKLIKTQTGLHSQLYYEYLFDGKTDVDIQYDATSKTITIPVIVNERAAKKRIAYKFTGNYFERVKN